MILESLFQDEIFKNNNKVMIFFFFFYKLNEILIIFVISLHFIIIAYNRDSFLKFYMDFFLNFVFKNLSFSAKLKHWVGSE